MPTVAAGGAISLIEPLIEPFIFANRNSTAVRLDKPVPTITTSGAHLALCEPFLLGQQSGAAPRAVRDPMPTVAAGGAISLIEPLIEPFIFANRTNNIPKTIHEPVPTLCTGNHIALVEPELAQGSTTTGRDIPGPIPVSIDGTPYLLDIRFRMLAPHELAQAQGFTPRGIRVAAPSPISHHRASENGASGVPDTTHQRGRHAMVWTRAMSCTRDAPDRKHRTTKRTLGANWPTVRPRSGGEPCTR